MTNQTKYKDDLYVALLLLINPHIGGINCSMKSLAIIVVSVLTLLSACSEEEKVYGGKYCLPKGNETTQLVGILKEKGLEFKFIEDEKCIYYDFQDQAVIKESKTKIFGIAPPSGRSTSFGSKSEEVEAKLLNNGIEVSISRYHGDEFLTWSLADVGKVETLLQFPLERREMLKEMRDGE